MDVIIHQSCAVLDKEPVYDFNEHGEWTWPSGEDVASACVSQMENCNYFIKTNSTQHQDLTI